MNKIINYRNSFIMLISTLLLFGACSKIDANDEYAHFLQPARIGILDTVIQLNVQGTETYTIVTPNGQYDSWEATSSVDWLTLTKGVISENGKEEDILKISANANTYYSRTGLVTVTLTSGTSTLSRTIRVVQSTALEDPKIQLAEPVLNLSAAAQNKTLAVTTNQDVWVATANAEWVTVGTLEDSLVVTVTANTMGEAREAVINLVAGTAPHTATATLRVIQAKPDSETNITVSGIELVLVEGGSFMLGAQNTDPMAPNYGVTDGGSGFNANQGPVHQVTLSPFYIGKFQITQDQWMAVMETNPSRNTGPGKGNFPVEYVTWDMATEFVSKLSQLTGKTFRLPTEAEWEYAARGGQKSQGFVYSGGNVADQVGNFVAATEQRNTSRTTAVGSFFPNELGIYDMSGNLYEWCSDFFEAYTAEAKTNPTGPASGTRRVMRGGSWWHLKTSVYYRGNNTPDYTGTHANAGLTGFRVVYIP